MKIYNHSIYTKITTNIKKYKKYKKIFVGQYIKRAEVNEYKPRNTKIEETIKLFNKLRNSFSREKLKKLWEKFHKKERDSLTEKVEIEKFRRKFCGKEKVYNILKEKGNLTNTEEKIQINIVKYFKDLKEELSKIKTN